MLKSLYIKNYALFDEINVSFGSHLNIITGETGAGKSLIVDALNAILGDKVNPTSLRDTKKKAIIEGIFDPPDPGQLEGLLDREDVEVDREEVILRREIHPSGRSRSFLNDSPVTMHNLDIVGQALIDLHGQHKHQSLLSADNHLDFLDKFGGLEELRSKVKSHHQRMQKLSDQLSKLREEENQMNERKEFLEFQLEEIDKVNPRPEEDEKLKKERKIVQNAEQLSHSTEQAQNLLYEDSSSVYSQLTEAIQLLGKIASTDEQFEDMVETCNSMQIRIEEIARELRLYHREMEFSPGKLDQINERLANLNRLTTKHGSCLDDVLKYKDQISEKLQNLQSLSDRIEGIENQLDRAKEDYINEAKRLSEKRSESIPRLEKRVEDTLQDLGMEKAQFEIKQERKQSRDGKIEINGNSCQPDESGIDHIEFYMSANPGEEVKPLIEVVSGGEMSRIMLALKSILAHKDRIPTLVFDEIDRGISGHIAHKLGTKLSTLADSHQLICITHLPQIACQGDYHLSVSKSSNRDRTTTSVQTLDFEGRVSQIAKLIGGEKVTQTNLENAKELLNSKE